MPDRVFVTLPCSEMLYAESISDWKRVAEILEREGRADDAKTIRRSVPYAQQQVRLAWERLRKSVRRIIWGRR